MTRPISGFIFYLSQDILNAKSACLIGNDPYWIFNMLKRWVLVTVFMRCLTFYFGLNLFSLLEDALSLLEFLLLNVQVISTTTVLYLQCQIQCSQIILDLHILLHFYWTALNLFRRKYATNSKFPPLSFNRNASWQEWTIPVRKRSN